jgi:hypothetical protein
MALTAAVSKLPIGSLALPEDYRPVDQLLPSEFRLHGVRRSPRGLWSSSLNPFALAKTPMYRMFCICGLSLRRPERNLELGQPAALAHRSPAAHAVCPWRDTGQIIARRISGTTRELRVVTMGNTRYAKVLNIPAHISSQIRNSLEPESLFRYAVVNASG